jgi:hypothetical protein
MQLLIEKVKKLIRIRQPLGYALKYSTPTKQNITNENETTSTLSPNLCEVLQAKQSQQGHLPEPTRR